MRVKPLDCSRRSPCEFVQRVTCWLFMSVRRLALTTILSSAESHPFASPADLDFEIKDSCSSCRLRHLMRGEVHSPGARIISNSWTIAHSSSTNLSFSTRSNVLPRASSSRRRLSASSTGRNFYQRVERKHRQCHLPGKVKTARSVEAKGGEEVCKVPHFARDFHEKLTRDLRRRPQGMSEICGRRRTDCNVCGRGEFGEILFGSSNGERSAPTANFDPMTLRVFA